MFSDTWGGEGWFHKPGLIYCKWWAAGVPAGALMETRWKTETMKGIALVTQSTVTFHSVKNIQKQKIKIKIKNKDCSTKRWDFILWSNTCSLHCTETNRMSICLFSTVTSLHLPSVLPLPIVKTKGNPKITSFAQYHLQCTHFISRETRHSS